MDLPKNWHFGALHTCVSSNPPPQWSWSELSPQAKAVLRWVCERVDFNNKGSAAEGLIPTSTWARKIGLFWRNIRLEREKSQSINTQVLSYGGCP